MSFAVFIAASAICSISDATSPYETMQQGFAARDPSIVASAYETDAILGGVFKPKVRNSDELIKTFQYVAPADGRTLIIHFKILFRDIGETAVGDVGLYRITDGDKKDYGKFTTALRCNADSKWVFVADLMSDASETDWVEAVCASDAICAE